MNVRLYASVGIFVFTLCALLFGSEADPLPAFPGAEGAGAFVSGGRGGEMYIVTNTNPSGPGSLADAVSQPNRYVVFAVSGIINLVEEYSPQEEYQRETRSLEEQKAAILKEAEESNQGEDWIEKKIRRAKLRKEEVRTASTESQLYGGRILVDQPNITIAGQTAPGEGITIIHGSLNIKASNVIVQNIRVRRGYIRKGTSGDGITIKGNEKVLEKIIIDHCSASWSTDENITATGRINNVTVQYSIAAEGLDYFNLDQTPPRHSEGSLFGSTAPDGTVSFHHIIYANNRLRNPRVTGDVQTPLALMDLRNCVIANWVEYATQTGSGGARFNMINNYYQPGIDTWSKQQDIIFTVKNKRAPMHVYASGNHLVDNPDVTQNNWAGIEDRKENPIEFGEDAEYFNGDNVIQKMDKPFKAPKVTTHSAEEAYRICLEESGAILPSRDPVDYRIIKGVRWGAGRVINTELDLPEDRRWPTVWSLPPYQDSDEDGMPDYWEEQYNLDAHTNNAMEDADGDGYANVEEYTSNGIPVEIRKPVVWIAAHKPRAIKYENEPAEFRAFRNGSLAESLTVKYQVSGTAKAIEDYIGLQGAAVIPAGEKYTTITIETQLEGKTDMGLRKSEEDKSVVISIAPGNNYFTGCPGKAMVVIQEH